MKGFHITIISVLLLSLALIGQSEANPAANTSGVDAIYLAKDDGSGKAGEAATSFLTTDIPIYCVVQLDSMDPVTVKMNLVAVNVKGVKAETKVITTAYKTNGTQSRVNFSGTPDGNWVAGNYRVDIFVNDKPAGNETFDIHETPQTSPNDKPAATKRATKPKSIRTFRTKIT